MLRRIFEKQCEKRAVTSIFTINSLAVGAERTMCRAAGLMKPSATPLSNKASKEL